MKRTLFCILIIIIAFILSACNSSPTPSDTPTPRPIKTPEHSPEISLEQNKRDNELEDILVDERFELVSLVFRLAGNPEYSELSTEYQRRLNSEFNEFRNHPIVTYTNAKLRFVGYDAVFGMAIHLDKTGSQFHLINNNSFLLEEQFARWTEAKALEFVELLNDFYIETNFAGFFQKHYEYYKEHSVRFTHDIINKINFEWFKQHGINPKNMRIVLSPSDSSNGYGGWINGENSDDSIVYAALPVVDDFQGFLSFVIHEFTHAIGTPLAIVWYAENDEFRSWADSSVNLERYPQYSYGITMASEYVTRAYQILYLAENTEMSLAHLLLMEHSNGFPFIQNIYAMITEYEIIDDFGSISGILGVNDYIIGNDYSIDLGGRKIVWHIIDLLGHELHLETFSANEVGNIFNTQAGDVLYVISDGTEYLYIDLGSAQGRGWSAQHRMYCVFKLDYRQG